MEDKKKTEELEDFKVETPMIRGVTTINHRARVELGLNCSEFVLMNFIVAIVEAKKKYDWIQCYRMTGFTKDQQGAVAQGLIKKGFIFPEQGDPPKLTDKWYSAFTDLEKEFNFFWKDIQGRNAWPGSKPKAMDLFIKRRKEGVPLDLLIRQKNIYFDLLRYCELNNFGRQKMMATVFLGEQRRWEEEWDVQLKIEMDKYNKNKQRQEDSKDIEPITLDRFKKAMTK